MKIGDKVEYKENGYIYAATVVAVKEDNSTVLISVHPLGKVVEIANS